MGRDGRPIRFLGRTGPPCYNRGSGFEPFNCMSKSRHYWKEIAAFKVPGARIVIGFDHPHYAHMAAIPEPVRAALAEDFD